jgi:geranylgeranyl diphosphate synthase, type I
VTSTARDGAPPEHLHEVAARVGERLAAFLAGERARWHEVDAAIDEPLRQLSAFVLGGGKRLRPAFCHWGWVAAGGDPDAPAGDGAADGDGADGRGRLADVVGAGAALEMLHCFALIHDDVMDASQVRRGAPTVHVQLADQHRRAGWSGDPDRYGEGGAILVGDMALVYADMLLGDVSPEAWRVFHEVRVELNVGQYLDLTAAARRATDLDTARRIARYKTGTYTIERPLHLGAALGGGLDRLGPALSAYGLPLGEAFQLRDDLLGAFGDAEVTGKPVGDDFREGKATVLVALAAARAKPDQAAVLALVGRPDLDPDQVAAIHRVLVATGAVEAVEGSIAALHAEAVAALGAADVPPAARLALEELAGHVAWRDR